MDAATDDPARSDVDAEMVALTPEDIGEENLDGGDEVEDLRNSLREVVHDDNVQAKMQCLMMDSSFSMVTMQGEDSGIAWETTPSRCNTPWASEAGTPTVDLSSPVAVRHSQPGSVPAGKIIFVMDEELMSRRRRTKERASGHKRQREGCDESSENISGRPELVGVSEPNVKTKGEGDEDEPMEPPVDKEQRLFSLVSEGSEILNIVVPPKFASVDEEESKEMVDNLSYLEESSVPKANQEANDNEMLSANPADAHEQTPLPPPKNFRIMDPPGAPVPRPHAERPRGHVDYFEAFTMIEAQAPGGPAVIAEGQEEPEAEGSVAAQGAENVAPFKRTTTPEPVDRSDTISLGEITSELLDEVFYGGTDDYLAESVSTEVRGGPAAGSLLRVPSKPSGSTLFGSHEDILTPIFLPEGPPKIIDPILLEEPKAMAFLYTDLYEEAIGSRQKEEDTESMTSEKSFHSRHSDREARGYLEKYALIDETPVVEMEASEQEKVPDEGPRTLQQDLYESDFLAKPEQDELPITEEEEATDFFRSSANSSPCEMEPLPPSDEEDDKRAATKRKPKSKKSVSITSEKAKEIPADPLSISSFEFPEEPDWGGLDEHTAELDEKDLSSAQEVWKQDFDFQKPVAPPRKKPKTSFKSCLDLTPLTPVDGDAQEEEEAGGKEQRVEEKETASPAETADEGDGEETTQLEVAAAKEIENPAEAPAEQDVAAAAIETDVKQSEAEEINIQSAEVKAETQADDSPISPQDTAKDKGHCVIL